MKVKSILASVAFTTMLGLAPLFAHAEQKTVQFVTDFGVIISPGYNDVLNDAYHNMSVSGGFGWIDFGLGVRFNATKNLSFSPGIDLLMNYVTGDESYINTLFLPSLDVRLLFQPVYLRGLVNYGMPNMGSYRLEADSGGAGFGFALGFASESGSGAELGYMTVPVDVDGADKNFGGFFIRYTGAF